MPEYAKPSATYTSRLSLGTGSTGLVGTLRFRLLDNDLTVDDPIYGPATTNIIEDPTGTGEYLFHGTAPTTAGKYTRTWDTGVGTDLLLDDDLIVTLNSALIVAPSYATVEELMRILKIKNPSDAQLVALQRVLDAALTEIDSELGRDDPFDDPPPALVVEVNLERAVEHWGQGDIPFGIVGLGDAGAVYTARDTWDRHALKLAPLKESWGLA